jgi:hypothetical protein
VSDAERLLALAQRCPPASLPANCAGDPIATLRHIRAAISDLMAHHLRAAPEARR